MTYIQKIRLKGFKSFAKPIDIPFGRNFNVILGPNGSGKSNVMDALCFVLGKSSAKSMRAEKSVNLIYNGAKTGAPAKEAQVDIHFDNSNKKFPIAEAAVKISRIVRKNGQSIYKINDKTMTRQHIVDLLSAADIDVDGHNIILQGDIVNHMSMHTEDRRKIIEEISGISVYEDKKNSALKELGKVDGKLKEVDIILTERKSHLRELEKDRNQALKFKELEGKIKNYKATYFHKKIKEKEKRRDEIDNGISKHKEGIAKIQSNIGSITNKIQDRKNSIEGINKEIEEKGEIEQQRLSKEIGSVKEDLIKNITRLEVCDTEILKIGQRKIQLNNSLKENDINVTNLTKNRIGFESNVKELMDEEKNLIENIQKLREKSSPEKVSKEVEQVNKQIANKGEKQIGELKKEINELKDELVKNITKLGICESEINKISQRKVQLNNSLKNVDNKLDDLDKNKIGFENEIGELIDREKGILDDIEKIRSKISPKKVQQEIEFDIKKLYVSVNDLKKIISKLNKNELKSILTDINTTMSGVLSKIGEIGFDPKDKNILNLKKLEQEQIGLRETIIKTDSEIKNVGNQINMHLPERERILKILDEQTKEGKSFSSKIDGLRLSVQNQETVLKEKEDAEKRIYNTLTGILKKVGVKGLGGDDSSDIRKLEQEQLGLREKIMELNSEIKTIGNQISTIHVPEKNRALMILKEQEKEKEQFFNEIKNLKKNIQIQKNSLKEKEGDEKKFYSNFKNLALRRSRLSEEVNLIENQRNREEFKIREVEIKINSISLNRAKLIGELEGLKAEYEEHKEGKILVNANIEEMKFEIKRFERLLHEMGNVNMRSVEIYDEVQQEYAGLLEKADKLKVEKEDVLGMMAEIDSKKKDLFMETLNEVATKFTRVFSELSNKAEAFLVLENKERPFEGGLDLRVKVAGSKYLDLRCLSGGEKTLVALAFIFAIQEHKPASFYLLDEIDAALDKNNSEKLSKLIAKYSGRSQYVLISHNDSIISEANQIYGVSMQKNGISKVISLKV